ncbi:MAG: histidine kinase [Clostridia bacterium]|nr:histidine kinase [Clostridia bacterium]
MQKKRMPFRSIRYKVVAAFLAVTVLVLSGSFVYFRHYARETAVERYWDQMTPLRRALENNLGTYIGTCVGAVHSVYYNEAVVRSINSLSSNFVNAETPDSKSVFSFLLSVYASLPAARQIRLAAYRSHRSFLLTTTDLVRYVDERPGMSFAAEYPERAGDSSSVVNWVEGSHPMHSYEHFVSPYTHPSGYVFTVHVPIFMLPDSQRPIGLISVDISTDYIDQNCGYISELGAEVYISDLDGRLIYAGDPALIGTKWQEVKPLEGLLSPEPGPARDSFVRDGRLITADLLDTSYCSWRINTVISVSDLTRDYTLLQRQLFIVYSCSMLLLAVIMYVITARYTSPLNRIAMFLHANFYGDHYELKARLADRFDYSANDEIRFLAENIDSMLDTFNSFVARQYQLMAARRTADLRTLQAQINPHFIYNTLQCIASKALEKGDIDSYHYIASFGQILQYAMDVDERLVTLSREIGHARRYLELQSVRFECLIRFDIDMFDPLDDMMVPKMTLQPLVENSLLHGRLNEKPDGRILLSACREDDRVCLELADNGIPITAEQEKAQAERIERLRGEYRDLKQAGPEELTPEKLLSWDAPREDQTREAHHGAHIGAVNVFSRFLLQYGSRCGFAMRANEFGGTTVRITVPIDRVRFERNDGKGEDGYETADRG